MAIISLLSILIALGIVFWFGRKIQWQSYVRNNLVEAAIKIRAEPLITDLANRAWQAPLDSVTNKFPQEAADIGLDHTIWQRDVDIRQERLQPYSEPAPFLKYDAWLSSMNISDSDKAKKDYEKQKCNYQVSYDQQMAEVDKQKKGIDKYKEWEQKERNLYDLKKEEALTKAKKEIEAEFPKSMDVSILGTGFSFLLEFSAIIVIIFAVITMGVIGVLTGTEIAPILAAIAGYVLGKGSKQSTPPSQEEQQTVKATPQPKA